MEHILNPVDRWLINKLLSYKDQLEALTKTATLEDIKEWSDRKLVIAKLEQICFDRGLGLPEIV